MVAKPVVSLLICCFYAGLLQGRVSTTAPKIAIIGGGIGGTSCAFFLRKLLGSEANIHIFEREETLGGRLATVEIDGEAYEAGGSIIHPKNRYMLDFINLLGLRKRTQKTEELMGIYNGQEFVFRESSWSILTLIKLLFRYRLDVFRLQRDIEHMLEQFDRIYAHQASGYGFSTVDKLLKSMSAEFSENAKRRFADYLQGRGYSRRFSDELLSAAVRVNYGQNLNVTGFVGTVAIAGAQSGLWAVESGNFLVAERLLNRSEATLHQCNVRKIERKDDGKFDVVCDPAEGAKSQMIDQFDLVVLAVPMIENHREIEFQGFAVPDSVYGPYHRLYVTFVRGELNNGYFKCKKSFDDCPSEVLVCSADHLWFNSVGAIATVNGSGPSPGKSPVYKIFSEQPLKDDQVKILFSKIDLIKRIDWFAYPEYTGADATGKVRAKFKLSEGVYHVNAIEWAASAMEMSVIGARNVALLIYHYVFSRYQQQAVNVGQTADYYDNEFEDMHWEETGRLEL